MAGVSCHAWLIYRPTSSFAVISGTPSGPCPESFHRTVGAWLPSEGIYERVPDSSYRHLITQSQKGSHCPPVACLQEAAQQVPPIPQEKELEMDMPFNRHPLRSHNNRRDTNFTAVFSSAALRPMSKHYRGPPLLFVTCQSFW